MALRVIHCVLGFYPVPIMFSGFRVLLVFNLTGVAPVHSIWSVAFCYQISLATWFTLICNVQALVFTFATLSIHDTMLLCQAYIPTKPVDKSLNTLETRIKRQETARPYPIKSNRTILIR